MSFLFLNTSESPTFLINAHEHIKSPETASVYQAAALRYGIGHTSIFGSPEAALEPGKRGFQKADEHNLQMLDLARQDPSKYSFFAAIDPEDPSKLKRFKKYIRMGAVGLKLYSGHSAYHRRRLNDETMLPIYKFCERENLPIIFHVNPSLYQAEFESVLSQFPKLKVVCPHYCLSTIRWDRFRELMDRYPNLYTDTSFGFVEYFKEALIRFSENPEMYRELIIRYQDRILFGLDLVVNDENYKDQRWIENMIKAYRDVLEKRAYTFFDLPGVTLHGLNLELDVLRKIYFLNFQRIIRRKSE